MRDEERMMNEDDQRYYDSEPDLQVGRGGQAALQVKGARGVLRLCRELAWIRFVMRLVLLAVPWWESLVVWRTGQGYFQQDVPREGHRLKRKIIWA